MSGRSALKAHECVERFYMARIYDQVFRSDLDVCAKDGELVEASRAHSWLQLRHLVGVSGPLHKMAPWLQRGAPCGYAVRLVCVCTC